MRCNETAGTCTFPHDHLHILVNNVTIVTDDIVAVLTVPTRAVLYIPSLLERA